jgi:hypothetical protein
MPPRWAPLEEHVIVHSRLDSRHLAANLLGDPSERDVFVYLPPGYEASDRRYPVAYLLHALGDSAATRSRRQRMDCAGSRRSRTSWSRSSLGSACRR